MGIRFLCCAHGKETTTFHDVVQDVFASIMGDAYFHVAHE
jgi:hypothetical protein